MDRHLLPLGEARLAAHVTSAVPVWLFAGERLLFANAAAAALSGFASPRSLLEGARALVPVAQQVARLAPLLPHSGTARLERLRGLGRGIGAAMVCSCARLTLADGVKAVLVAGTENGPLSLAERVRRWLADAPPVAVYSTGGELIAAAPSLLTRAPVSLGAGDALMKTALEAGRAEGSGPAGRLRIERLGTGHATVLAVAFADHASPETPDPIETISATSATEAAEPTGDEHRARPAEPAPPGPTTTQPAPVSLPQEPRRPPLRFVWQTDAENRFTLVSPDFVALAGERTRALLGRRWSEIKDALAVDADGRFDRAIASHDTFSGIKIDWPLEGSTEPLRIEMSGLPVIDRERAFRGYRGFGVCRTVAQEPRADRNSATDAASLAPALSPQSEPPPIVIEPQPSLPLGPGTENVVPFRGGGAMRAALSPVERTAFREIAKALGARIEGEDDPPEVSQPRLPIEPAPPPPPAIPSAFAPGLPAREPVPPLDHEAIRSNRSNGMNVIDPNHLERDDREKPAPAFSHPNTAEEEARELRAILDTATDGVIVTDPAGAILSVNKSAEALFGYDARDLVGRSFAELFAPESRRAAADYLDGLTRGGVESVLNDGREVIGQVRQGGLIPLFMTIGRIGEAGGKYCAVLRDVTQWKRAEEDLVNAKRLAEKASSAKSEFLAKVSHEIRTPLNVIIGFSEVMIEERFGPLGNERYRDYLRDIHASGAHLVSLVNDLLDLSKIEAGKIELTFTSVNLNAVAQQCVALMQPQANRERIIIRTSLTPAVPPVVVDERSMRQIMLNLLSNAIKFTGAGGQVIVSTAFTERAEVVLRVRDTGVGMSEEDIESAMQPFRQLAISGRRSGEGTGLGLPLTKALAEANRATFVIKSAPNSGTLVEITFPATRVLAE